MKFKPKVNLGSILSLIVSILGIVAAFYPSLLNFEKDNIARFSIILSDDNSFINLYDFLSSHQEKIVNLHLEYKEENRSFFTRTQAGNLTIDNYVKFIEQGKLKMLTKNSQIESRYGFGKINNYACIFSNFKSSPEKNLFSREYGSIGVYITNNSHKTHREIAYIIIIPKTSSDNTLYQWCNFSDTKNDSFNNMILSGTFFVNKFISSSIYSTPIFRFMPPLWYITNTGEVRGQEIIIDLSPIAPKKISKSSY